AANSGHRGFSLNVLENGEALELLKNIIGKTAYMDKVVDIDESTSGSSRAGNSTWISSPLYYYCQHGQNKTIPVPI
ncbi:hypothetical protein DBR06_SOUSAS18210017, partial [Sousa chinensis]